MTKERSQPLPSPYQPSSPDVYSHDNLASPVLQQPPRDRDKVARRNSQKNKGYWQNPTPKTASPTHPDQGKMLPDHDPSAAAMVASSHLTASMTGGAPSPNPALPSPTSPNNHPPPPYHQTASRVYNDRSAPNTGSSYGYSDGYPPSTASALVSDPASAFRSNAVSNAPGRSRGTTRDNDDSPSAGSGAPSVEIFKSFRVSMDDPCHKVLPAALKKYNIQADWRQYALYIVYGDQERCLGLEEKPLILFKQLDKEGRKPMFMLRRHAPPSEGHSGPSGMLGFDGGMVGQRAHQSSIQLPGGVL